MTRVPGVPRIRLVVALDRDGAARPAGMSDVPAFPFPAIRGLTDSILELVGRRDMVGAGLRDRLIPCSGVVRPDGVGEGVGLRLEPGRSGPAVARLVMVG